MRKVRTRNGFSIYESNAKEIRDYFVSKYLVFLPEESPILFTPELESDILQECYDFIDGYELD